MQRIDPMRPISLFLCMCLGACAPPAATVETTGATIGALDRYHTFSFENANAPPSGFRSSARGGEVIDIAEVLVAEALARKGFTHVAQDGDLVVVISVGRRIVDKEKPLSRTSVAITGDRVEIVQVPEGAIVIDAYDKKTRAEVWRGAATGEIDYDARKLDRPRAVETIDSIMTRFPNR
jgi:hypothetical protein